MIHRHLDKSNGDKNASIKLASAVTRRTEPRYGPYSHRAKTVPRNQQKKRCKLKMTEKKEKKQRDMLLK